VAVPLIELFLLIKLGKILGTLNTILIVILTGILGAAFARSQGAGMLSKIQHSLRQGKLPGQEMIEGILILAGGIMLITPGFITDLVGFSLILPFSRSYYSRLLLAFLGKKMKTGTWQRVDFTTQDTDMDSNDDSDDYPEIMQ
jgi:UPF0716 protein FxsA